jgi:ComF family protein
MRASWRCDRCGGTYHGAPPEHGRPCRLCPPEGAAYQGVLSVVGYGNRVARCVHAFKYSRREELGTVMARLMAEWLREPIQTLGGRIDCVAPVPLHWARRLTRGFNQSDLLARTLASAQGLSYTPRLLRRLRNTRRQALIPRDRRAENVKGAFAVRDGAQVRDMGILLVDDVVTTGFTIDECARVLRESGAREVWVASFARAGMGRPGDEE